MFKKVYSQTPVYGYIPGISVMFSDSDLFGKELSKYVVLRKVKIWYGTPKVGEENINKNEKIILGIQATYKDLLSGKYKVSNQNCAHLVSDDIITKELELKENDYFTNFEIEFTKVVTYLKFVTKHGQVLQLGKVKDENKKITAIKKQEENQMIQCLSGCYNIYGLRALACMHISKKDCIMLNLVEIFRLQNLFIKNKDMKQKWLSPENYDNLKYEMKAVVKICTLPKFIFAIVMRYLL